MNTPSIDIRSVTATYPQADRSALENVSLKADAELVALLGPNGSGKSTLIKAILGIHAPASGSIQSPTDRTGTAVVFQTPATDDLLTARENISTAAALHGVSRPDAHARIDTLAADLRLTEILEKRTARLSGGQRRRVDLARALVSHPAILILDEPTTGLDIDARALFWATLDRVRRERPTTILLATHLSEEAERADRVVLLKEGTLIADESPAELRAPLGDRAARVEPLAESDTSALSEWMRANQPNARAWSGGWLVASTDPASFESLPLEHASVRIGAPTLEDAYLWHTAGVGVTQ